MALCGIIKHHNKNEKPCVLGFWHFLTSERIAGFSACLSKLVELLAAKETSLQNAQAHIDRLLAIIDNLTKQQ